MRYTVESFIKDLIGDSYVDLINEGCDSIVWDGDYLRILADDYELDRVGFTKRRSGEFNCDLQARNCWYFTFRFSDGGFRKNKKYYLKDIYK